MSSKYTIETGEGYLGIHSVSGSMLSIGIETLPVDWQDGQTLYTSRDGDGVALTATQRDEQIGTGSVREQRYTGTSASGMLAVSLSVGAIEPLHVSDGDDVRVYERDGEGLLLVDADDDPRIMADGGSRFVCELCQDEHDTRADALRCCDDRFDDDLDERPSMSVVDEHGSPTVLTDGSGLRNETYLGVDDLLELAQEHAEDCDVIYHIRQARSLHNVRGGETDV